jgi:general secretion pathway protein A
MSLPPTTVLIIDDAQNLEGEVLEGIHQWDSLQDRRGRLLQTVLCGFPELERRLAAESLRALKQRVALRCHLRPFTEEETIQYIAGQLTKAGMAQQTIFARLAMAGIHARSGGLLRVVNIVCDKLLEKCFDARSKEATIGMLDKVSAELQLEA